MGILAGQSIRVEFHWLAILLFLLILSLLLFWNNKNFPGVKFQNILVASALLLSGACYIIQKPVSLLQSYDQKEHFIAEVCQKPAEKANTFQSVLKIQRKGTADPEKVIAYFSKEKFDSSILAGDQLALFVRPQEIKNAGNPFELDYKAMMRHKGIYSSVYLSPGTYHKTGQQINRLTYMAEHVRDQLIALLKATKLGDEERAVISALTLGYRAELDPETMDYFVDTGTIHVLSVSGLHVALIFIILNFLFNRINRGKYGKLFHGLLIILCLWSYAFITGFSPSVQRATVMLSFFIIGNLLRRPVNIYNSLSASALVLILVDPLVLYDIGFQLSYLAVFGIVLIQPPLENLLEVKNKLFKWAWKLFTISIAAQLITFPLSIYYFRQFPNLFWLSNFIAIPGTTLLIWITLGFFVLSPIGVLANLLGKLLQFITHWMLVILKEISNWPHAVSDGILYNQHQMLMVYGFIIAFVIFVLSKRKHWLYGAMILLISFQASMLWTRIDLFNQQVLYVYQTKGNLIHCINGRNSYVIKNNDQPFTEREIHMIRNVCDHLKLNKPRFILSGNSAGVTTDDLKANSESLCFLNCQIEYADQLNVCVQGKNFREFKMMNPSLFKKAGLGQSPCLSNENTMDNETFSLVFSTKYKEGVSIFMN